MDTTVCTYGICNTYTMHMYGTQHVCVGGGGKKNINTHSIRAKTHLFLHLQRYK